MSFLPAAAGSTAAKAAAAETAKTASAASALRFLRDARLVFLRSSLVSLLVFAMSAVRFSLKCWKTSF